MLRFAASPTGDMHIGDLRVALFNYIVSKQKSEDFIVRIEDTDKENNIEGKDQEIVDLLGLFGIEYSQVIYQSESVRFHSAMALQLVHEKRAFSCFCSSNWIDKKKEEAKKNKKAYSYDDACRNLPNELVIDNMSPFTIRLSRPEKDIALSDLIKGDISFDVDAVDSFVIMNQNKTPKYNFACAVDDMLNDISLVIRNEEHLNNTPKQAHIRASLGYEKEIQYAHIPTLLNDGTSNVKWLLEEGFLPSAISNYLISIGNTTPQEIFNIEDAIEWFSLDNLSKSPARFSLDTLRDINKAHLNNMEATELSRYVGFADANIGELAKVYLEEASTTKELKSKIESIFSVKEIPKEFEEAAELITKTIKGAPHFKEYDEFQSYIMKKSGLKDENFSQALRCLLTGAQDGPDIAEIYKYIKNYIGEIVK
ncbi:glutamate--tRNA ligase [Sulfurimonas sp.]|uniref:glutamate--tRNA ligase n=1 Tax=Sulfurimonas sp. TaxID=2022749 RepID=UPI0025D6DFD6|nr:glutamate--tRNA ligase [Sulfurimonas sp.]